MDNVFNQSATLADTPLKRQQLLPLWIKIFGWLFILLGALVPVLLVASMFVTIKASFNIFGVQIEDDAQAGVAMVVALMFIANAVCAYGLLFGKDWGLSACLIAGYVGVAMAIATIIGQAFSEGTVRLRLELIIQIFFLIKLHKIKPFW